MVLVVVVDLVVVVVVAAAVAVVVVVLVVVVVHVLKVSLPARFQRQDIGDVRVPAVNEWHGAARWPADSRAVNHNVCAFSAGLHVRKRESECV